MKKIIVALAAFAISVFGFQGSAQASTTYNLTIEIRNSFWWGTVGDTYSEAKDKCRGVDYTKIDFNRYGSIDLGSRATILSGSGKVLAVKPLNQTRAYNFEQKTWTSDPNDPFYNADWAGQSYVSVDCALFVKIKVPKSSFYKITIGSVNAGTYSFSELRSDRWALILSND